MAKKKYDDKVLGKITDLMSNRSSYFTRDINDFDTAKSCLSGFGFDKKDRELRGEMKPEITIPILGSWINQALSGYTSAPFGIGLKSQTKDVTVYRAIMDEIQNKNNLNDVISSALEEVLGVGYSYVLVTNEVVDSELNLQLPTIKLLDARRVVCDYSDDPELDDCDLAIVIDVMTKDKAKRKYKIADQEMRYGKDILNNFDVILDTNTQCSVITSYERINGEVQVTKIVYDRIVEQITLPISRLPIVRFYGDEVTINKEVHYRGAQHKISDLWKRLNYSASQTQFMIATAPSMIFTADRRSIAQTSSDWMAGSDVLVGTYDSSIDGEQLAAPQLLNKELQIQSLLADQQAISAQISQVLGNPTIETKQAETAEAVLTRRATSEASINKYLSNLKKSLKSLGVVLLDMIAITFDVPREINGVMVPPVTNIEGIWITVDDGPIQSSQKQKNLQQLLMLNQMATAANIPNAFQMFAPVILESSDLPVEQKKLLMSQLGGQPNQLPPEVQQQMAQAQQQIQTITQQAQKIISEKDKQLSALQQALFEMQNDSRAKILVAQIEAQNKLQLKQMELDNSNVELQTQIVADAQAQTQKLQAELGKEIIKERQAAPDIPVFDKGRFI